MFVAGATREQKSFEGGLQRLEFKKNNFQALCQFPYSGEFLLHTPRWLILSEGSFSYKSNAALHGEFLLVLYTLCWFMQEHLLRAPMLVYMGSFSYMHSAGLGVKFLLHTPCWLLSLVSFTHKVYAGFFMQQISSLQRKNVKVTKMYITE